MRPPPLRSILAALSTTAVLNAVAQDLYKGAELMEQRGIFNSTTYVQLLGESDYDTRIKEVLAQGWSITKRVEFIEPGAPMPDPSDPNHTFLSFWELRTEYVAPGRSDPTVERYLGFWQGLASVDREELQVNQFNSIQITKMNIMQVPLDIHGREEVPEYLAWRIPLVIRSMEQVVNGVREARMKAGATAIHPDEVIKGRAGALRQKTLLVWKGRFDEAELAALREHYTYPMEVVELPVILDAIAERDERYAILVLVAGYHHHVYVHDAATREMIYARYSKFGYDLKADHVKALVKAVEKE